MGNEKCTRPSGSRSRQATLMAMLIGCSVQACTAFASSKDTPALGSGDDPNRAGRGTPALDGRSSILDTPPGCAAEAAECNARLVAPVSPAGTGTVGPATQAPDRHSPTPDASDAAGLDAGAANQPAPAAGGAQPDAEAPSGCQGPGTFSEPGASTCYLWVSQPAAWNDARAACLLWGGALARIDSAGQDQLLGEHMSLDSWLGANDLGIEGEIVWQDGTSLTFTNWGEAQPDNYLGNEDCVEKLARSQAWNDAPCAMSNAYFCQRPLR